MCKSVFWKAPLSNLNVRKVTEDKVKKDQRKVCKKSRKEIV